MNSVTHHSSLEKIENGENKEIMRWTRPHTATLQIIIVLTLELLLLEVLLVLFFHERAGSEAYATYRTIWYDNSLVPYELETIIFPTLFLIDNTPRFKRSVSIRLVDQTRFVIARTLYVTCTVTSLWEQLRMALAINHLGNLRYFYDARMKKKRKRLRVSLGVTTHDLVNKLKRVCVRRCFFQPHM